MHPLLGRQIEQPQTSEMSMKRFENKISADSNGWVGDHLIGPGIIMPAAVFLEMTLASRYLTLDVDSRKYDHLKINNFSVQNPGFLTTKGVNYHTVLEANLVKIYSLVDKDNWILHSQGTIDESWSQDLNRVKDLIPLFEDKDTPSSISMEAVYEKLDVDGYHFGPSFLSITSRWVDQELNQYAKVKLDQTDFGKSVLNKFACGLITVYNLLILQMGDSYCIPLY